LDFPTPKPEGWTAPYGEMDQFQVVTQDKDGQTIVETIDIKIGTHTAEDDFNSIMIDSVNETSSVNWVLEKKVGDHGTSQEYKSTIANHDKDAPATLKVVTDSDGVITSKSVTLTYTLTNTTTGQVFTKTVEGVDVALEVTLDDLPAGDYTLQIDTIAGAIETVDFKFPEIIHSDEFKDSKPTTITGTLLENDLGLTMIDDIVFGNKQVSYADDNKGAKSITIEGEHGTLVVNKDGTYTHTPSGESFGVERFTYETVSIVGEVESATLEINVGKQITASIYDDIVTSSAGDDTFVMKDGAD